MKGICRTCKQEVDLVHDEGEEDMVTDSHDDRDGRICEGSGQPPAGEFDEIEE